jgi:alpha-N-arabinofuranosidase
MDATYYADLFKQYSTYAWVDYKVASGGLNDDFDWTEILMKETQNRKSLMQGISYHHYTVCHDWSVKGSAINFNENEWFLTIRKNYEMEENLVGHMNIMDKYDPDNKVGLIADEWGNWFDPEPGIDMGVLFQQNTLRDAITASIYLNIFNKHCRRVKMANIAQTVNVLQAMILTKEDKMVKTPTFYVFKMYNVHHDALLLPTEITCDAYKNNEEEVPALSVSASKDNNGIINVTVANVDPDLSKETIVQLANGEKFEIQSAKIITADEMNAYNDFGQEEKVNTQTFDDYKINGSDLITTLPSKSVLHLAIKTK